MDPYEVLGVSHDATPDEIKKAYRKKARENHPDLNPGDAAAAKRMNEINEAYDRLTNPDKYAREKRSAGPTAGGEGSPYGNPYNPYGSPFSGGGAGAGGQQGGNSAYDWINFNDFFGFGGNNEPIRPEVSANDSADVRRAINQINANNYKDAVNTLTNIPSSQRDARWYYLSAIANGGAGNTVIALDHIQKAVQMDPNNSDYQRAERQFRQTGQAYQQQTRSRGFHIGVQEVMACCCGLIAINMVCNMFRFYGPQCASMGQGMWT